MSINKNKGRAPAIEWDQATINTLYVALHEKDHTGLSDWRWLTRAQRAIDATLHRSFSGKGATSIIKEIGERAFLTTVEPELPEPAQDINPMCNAAGQDLLAAYLKSARRQEADVGAPVTSYSLKTVKSSEWWGEITAAQPTDAWVGPAPEEVAKWLIYGFIHSWVLEEVLVACGLPTDTQNKMVIHDKYPFLPAQYWHYNRTVRTIVASEWPKLNAYLIANEKNGEKMVKVIAQVVRLTATGTLLPAMGKEDSNFRRAETRRTRVANESYRLSREIYGSNQRSAWNVCKSSNSRS